MFIISMLIPIGSGLHDDKIERAQNSRSKLFLSATADLQGNNKAIVMEALNPKQIPGSVFAISIPQLPGLEIEIERRNRIGSKD